MAKIVEVHARRILDSRGNPTLEVDVWLDSGVMGRASVPSGASTGSKEAKEIRDGDMTRYRGKDVQRAIENVNQLISQEIISLDPTLQEEIDRRLIALDGTPDKSNLGANAILGVSLAVAKAAAEHLRMPLYRYIGVVYGEENPRVLPIPMMNVINGGVHAHNGLDFQEFMIFPLGAPSFSEAIRGGAEVFESLANIFNMKGYQVMGVGDEGGFSPQMNQSKERTKGETKARHVIEEVLNIILKAIEGAGYKPGNDIAICLDPAASQFFEDGKYILGSDRTPLTTEEMVDLYVNLVDRYPIVSIEDGMAEDDWEGWKLLTKTLGNKIQLVGDDVFATNPKIFRKGIQQGIANAILIKVNQIGTLTEALATIRMAKHSRYQPVISHRSGETVDTSISDVAVGVNAGQIKAGCVTRIDRVEKYNQLLRIEETLGALALYPR